MQWDKRIKHAARILVLAEPKKYLFLGNEMSWIPWQEHVLEDYGFPFSNELNLINFFNVMGVLRPIVQHAFDTFHKSLLALV